MNTENKSILIEDNLVVTMDYELRIDGEVVDSSEEGEPIIFLQGTGQIIPGLEKSIYGLTIGDKKIVTVQPKDGYGEIDPESIVEVPKDEFPDDFPLELGVEITVHTDNEEEDEEIEVEEEEDVEDDDDDDEDDDDLMEATIVAINEDTVTLDFNHPLAGKTLTFSVNIIDVREATPEELEHGHAHGDDSEFYFEDEDFDEIDEDEDNHHNH